VEYHIPINSITSETVLETTAGIVPGGSSLTWIWTETFNDLVKKKTAAATSMKAPQALNGVSSASSLTIDLLDWENTLRSNLIGTAPDLTDSNVNVFIALTDTTDRADLLFIYTGQITSYKIKNDVMSISIKNELPLAGLTPSTVLKDTYELPSDGITSPLQYGNFYGGVDLRYTSHRDKHGLAICPVVKTEGIITVHINIADHKMNKIDEYTTFANDGGATIYKKIGSEYAHSGVYNINLTNTASGCYADFTINTNTLKACWLIRSGTASGTSDSEVWDGQPETAVALSGSNTTIQANFPDFSDVNQNDFYLDGSNEMEAQIWIRTGAKTGVPSFTLSARIDGVTWLLLSGSTTTASQWLSYDISSLSLGIQNIADLDALEVKLDWNGSSGDILIKDVVFAARTEDLSVDDKYVYIKGRGREYSGTWSSRKTSGDLIRNPMDMIESLYRDEFSVTDLDTGSFDNLNSNWWADEISGSDGVIVFNTGQFSSATGDFITDGIAYGDAIKIDGIDYIVESVTSATALVVISNFPASSSGLDWSFEPSFALSGTILRQQDRIDLLKDLCKNFQINLSYNLEGKWHALQQKASFYNFTNSGSGTPADDDIFNQADATGYSGSDGGISSSTTFSSASASFQTWGVASGDLIIIEGVHYTVSSVTSETILILSSSADTAYNVNWSIELDIYVQHPFLKKSFNISRSSANLKFPRVKVQYKKTINDYLADVSSGTGDEKLISNPYIGGSVGANYFLNIIKAAIQSQHYVCSFVTFSNAIGLEIGDIINIQHDYLNNNMLNANVTTQKWMVFSISIKWHPFHIKIFAIELF